MNWSETRPPTSPDLGSGIIAGALAGLVIATQVSLLELLLWTMACSARADIKELARLSLQRTVHVVPCLLGAGLVGGLLLPMLLPRANPAIRRLVLRSALSLCVLGSFIYVISGPVPLILQFPLVLIEALLTTVLALAAYYFWYALLQWLRRGYVKRVLLAIAAMGVCLCISVVMYLVIA